MREPTRPPPPVTTTVEPERAADWAGDTAADRAASVNVTVVSSYVA